MALTKTFTIHESFAVKFRMDAFNAFNHINPGNPGGNIESDGTISGLAPAGTPRQLEFALRVSSNFAKEPQMRTRGASAPLFFCALRNSRCLSRLTLRKAAQS